jgi:hypothetical protein
MQIDSEEPDFKAEDTANPEFAYARSTAAKLKQL